MQNKFDQTWDIHYGDIYVYKELGSKIKSDLWGRVNSFLDLNGTFSHIKRRTSAKQV